MPRTWGGRESATPARAGRGRTPPRIAKPIPGHRRAAARQLRHPPSCLLGMTLARSLVPVYPDAIAHRGAGEDMSEEDRVRNASRVEVVQPVLADYADVDPAGHVRRIL